MNRVFKVGTLVSMLMLAGLVTGCASFPDNYQARIDAPVDAKAEVNWATGPAITYVDASSAMAVKKFSELPAALAAIPVEFKFAADVTLTDVAAALRTQNIKVVNALNVKSHLVEMRVFKGTVGEFLAELAMANNIGYEYMNGVVFLKDVSRFAVTLPQNESLFTKVTEVITAFGAVNVIPDIQAGQIFYAAKPDSSAQIAEYLQIVAQNSAMVTLQVAVLDVSLSRDRNIGIDWSQLGAQVGTQDWTPLPASGIAAAIPILGQSLGMTGTGISFKLATSNFSLSAVLRALSTMGEAKTEQNVTMGTLSGIPVKITSGNSIPYVKSIGATTTSAVGAAAVQGTAVTDIVKSGLKLEVTPNFNASDMSITTTLKADMSSLVGFRELSAGANLGTLSQPEIQEMTFQNMGRLTPGETLVVGGITYDQVSKNYTSFPGLEKEIMGSKAEKVQKHAIYIVVRPSVTLFGKPPVAAVQPKQAEPVIAPVAVATPVSTSLAAIAAVTPSAATVKPVKPDFFMRVVPLKSGESTVLKARTSQQYKVVRDTVSNVAADGVTVARQGEDLRLTYADSSVTLENFYSVCKSVEQCSIQLPGQAGAEYTLSGNTAKSQSTGVVYTNGVQPQQPPAFKSRPLRSPKVAK